MILEYQIEQHPGVGRLLASWLSPKDQRTYATITIWTGGKLFPTVICKADKTAVLETEITLLSHDDYWNWLYFEGKVRPSSLRETVKVEVTGRIWLQGQSQDWLRICDDHEEVSHPRIAEPIQSNMIETGRKLTFQLSGQPWLGEAVVRRILNQYQVLANVPPNYSPPR